MKHPRVTIYSGPVKCRRCRKSREVRDLTPSRRQARTEREFITCTVCGELNGLQDAIKRAKED